MTRWPMRSLEDIATVYGGSTPARGTAAFWGGDIPWVTPTDLPVPEDGISTVSTTAECINPAGLANSSATLVPAGTVLFSSRATVGKVAVADVPLATNQGFANFVAGPAVLPRYLAYVLWYRRTDIARLSGSTTFKEVSRGTLRKYLVPVPPLAEQERIVALLDEADALRKLRAQADQRTADLIPSLFHDMFGDLATNPMGWPVIQLREAGRLDRGRSKHRPRNDPRLFGGEYPFIQTGDVANSDGIISTFSQTYSEEGLKQSRLWPEGTLCITIAANIGLTGILSFPACFPDSIVGLTPGPHFTVEYLRYWFVAIQRHLEDSAPQMAQRNINLKILASLDVPAPPLFAQEAFVAQVGKLEKLSKSQASCNVSVNTLFESLLAHTFAGGE